MTLDVKLKLVFIFILCCAIMILAISVTQLATAVTDLSSEIHQSSEVMRHEHRN